MNFTTKNIILLFLTIFSVNTIHIFSMDLNNNNNNNKKSVNEEYQELPEEIWHLIISKLINNIQNASTLPELESVVNNIFAFSLTNKKNNEIVNYLINKKEFKLNEKKIKLTDLYIQRKKEILENIKNKFPHYFPFDQFNDIDATDNDGKTALMWAAQYYNKAIGKLLIANGANVNSEDNNGYTALILATSSCVPNLRGNEFKEIIKLLMQNGADVNAKANNGYTALMFVASSGYKLKVESLISNGANINSQDNNGYTALMFATLRGHKEIVKLLIQNNANINIKNKDNVTALGIAVINDYKEIIELLVTNGADTNIAFKNFITKDIKEIFEKHKNQNNNNK